jgi:DNA (cytosine-5)-methyltransferase 1
MTVYYNEKDKHCAQTLRNLIAAGLIAAGDVDERDIRDVRPSDLAGYVQCHFFAGLGGWPYAGRLAGWADDRPIWTGSCPCQPFSIAGRRRGETDNRHLWPDFHRLIRACRPAVVMGEQVAGTDGEIWIDGICSDLENDAFAVRPVDVTAFAVNAPHERQRLYWIAERLGNATSIGRREGRSEQPRRQRESASSVTAISGGMGDPDRLWQLQSQGRVSEQRRRAGNSDARWLGNAMREGPSLGPAIPGGVGHPNGGCEGHPTERSDDASFWHDAEDVFCAWDGKTRRSQPCIPMLVDGFSGRVAAFSAFGNAIVAPLAAEVIAAYMDCHP